MTPFLAAADSSTTDRARAFIDAFTTKVRPLDIAANRAWWDANITGKDEDFKRKEEAQNRIDEALADRATFAELRKLKEANKQKQIDDPLLARQIEPQFSQAFQDRGIHGQHFLQRRFLRSRFSRRGFLRCTSLRPAQLIINAALHDFVAAPR